MGTRSKRLFFRGAAAPSAGVPGDEVPLELWPTEALGGRRAITAAVAGFAVRLAGWLVLPFAILLEQEDRKLRHLFQAMPAAAALSLGVAAVVAVGGQSATLEKSYRSAAAAALAEKDAEAAKVYAERLCTLSDVPEYRYDLALAYDRSGDGRRAEALIRRVAADRGFDLPEAHVWLADRLLDDPDSWSPERLAEAHRHLLLASRSSEYVGVDVMLTRFYVALRDHKSAVEHLTRAADVDPRLNLDLAVLYEKAGLRESARLAASRAEQEYSRQVRQRPEDHETRVRWAVCLIGLGRFDEAVEALDRGRHFWPDGRYDELLARAYVGRYEQLAAAGAEPAVRLKALTEALGFEPRFEPALLRLVEFSDAPASDASAAEAREVLERLLAAGEAPAAVHLALGVRSWDKGDEDRSLWHLERAYELEPSFAATGNNLAWLLMSRPDADLAHALRVIDPVGERWPDVAEFRDTRGQVLAKLGRWDKAADDLERAVGSGMRGNVRTRRALAEALRRTEKPDLGAMQDAEADRIEAGSRRRSAATKPDPDGSVPTVGLRS